MECGEGVPAVLPSAPRPPGRGAWRDMDRAGVTRPPDTVGRGAPRVLIGNHGPVLRRSPREQRTSGRSPTRPWVPEALGAPGVGLAAGAAMRLRPGAGLSPAACDLPPCSLSCPPGEHCEVNVRSGRCASGVCKNGGTCVNLLIGGFHCVCPPGEFERPYCEVTTRSFPPQSFVTFRGLRQRFHFTVALA